MTPIPPSRAAARPRPRLAMEVAAAGVVMVLAACAGDTAAPGTRPLPADDIGGAAGPASWAPGRTAVMHGTTVPLNPVFQSMTTDCRSLPRPTVRILRAPRLGEVEARPAKGIATFGPGPWEACRGRIGSGTVLFYLAGARRGVDRFTVEVTHSDGSRVVVPHEIEVR